jgi:hypothetical protein
MLLNGHERANAPKSAVAAARGLGEHGISRDASPSFWVQQRRRSGVLRC